MSLLLNRDQIQKYFENRFDGQRLSFRGNRMAVCCVLPGHQERTASATIYLDGNGGFNCHGCSRKGNLFTFEMMFSGCNNAQAEQNIANITGARPYITNGWKQVAVYDYRDAENKVVFQKRRLEHETEGKRFAAYHPVGVKWSVGIDPEGGFKTERVLYNLPEVVTANVVAICEGEGKVDVVNALSLYPERPELKVAGTCNFDGAWKPEQSPKWLERYNKYFAGKFVLIFEDNDAPGRTWSEHIANSLYGMAAGIKIIRLPGLGEAEDVKDWMQSHSVEDLREEIKKVPRWQPERKQLSQRVFVSGVQFMKTLNEEIEWYVDGVIQKGANGMIVADPGAGKSFLALDLAISLATGSPWLGLKVPSPIRTGYCAREDNPALTSWRLRHLLMGKDVNGSLFEQNIWINSRWETPQLLLNDEVQVQELIGAIQDRQLQLVFLDVFSVLHTVNENKAEEMAPVLENCRRIQRETGCAVGIVHHFNKQREGSITQRSRGTSSLGGFAEWMLGLELDVASKVRTLSFGKVKAGRELAPIAFTIDSSQQNVVKLTVLEAVDKSAEKSARVLYDDGKAMAVGSA